MTARQASARARHPRLELRLDGGELLQIRGHEDADELKNHWTGVCVVGDECLVWDVGEQQRLMLYMWNAYRIDIQILSAQMLPVHNGSVGEINIEQRHIVEKKDRDAMHIS